jgi:hypothetical protein
MVHAACTPPVWMILPAWSFAVWQIRVPPERRAPQLAFGRTTQRFRASGPGWPKFRPLSGGTEKCDEKVQCALAIQTVRLKLPSKI